MPAHRQTPNPRDFEPAAIHFEPIAVLLEAETFEAGPALETRVAWFFSHVDAAKEGLEGFIQIAHDRLQHMAVDRASGGVGRFVSFDLA